MSGGFGWRQWPEKMAVMFLPCFVVFGTRDLSRLQLFGGLKAFGARIKTLECRRNDGGVK